MELVLTDTDLITAYCYYLDTGKDYKSAILTCHAWYAAVKSESREHSYMNVASTIVMKYIHLPWHKLGSFEILQYMHENVVKAYFTRHEIVDDRVFKSKYISVETIKKHLKLVNDDIAIVSQNPNFTTSDLVEIYGLENIDYNLVCSHKSFTLEMLETHLHRLGGSNKWQNPNINIDFIEKHINNVDWFALSINDCLTIEMIDKYHDRLKWPMITVNFALISKLIDKYKHKINTKLLIRNPNADTSIIKDHIKDFDAREWMTISRNNTLTRDFIDQYKDKFYWGFLSTNRVLTGDLMEKYEDLLCWPDALMNPNCTLRFAMRNIDKIIDKLKI